MDITAIAVAKGQATAEAQKQAQVAKKLRQCRQRGGRGIQRNGSPR